MKLSIKRHLRSGLMGGSFYSLTAHAFIVDQDIALIERHKAWKVPITHYKSDSFEYDVTIHMLQVGETLSVESIIDLFDLESRIIDGCATITALIKALRGFDDELIIEINEPEETGL